MTASDGAKCDRSDNEEDEGRNAGDTGANVAPGLFGLYLLPIGNHVL